MGWLGRGALSIQPAHQHTSTPAHQHTSTPAAPADDMKKESKNKSVLKTKAAIHFSVSQLDLLSLSMDITAELKSEDIIVWSWLDTTEGIRAGLEGKDRNTISEALTTITESFKLSNPINTSRAEKRVRTRIGREARLHIVEEEAYQGAFYTQL